MSPYTDHTKPLPEYRDIFLPEYKDVEKTLYPSGAFDEDDTPLRIGDKPSGIRGRWEKLSGVKKALGVILAIWAMMALIAIGRGKGRFEWDGEGGLDGVGFGELDSYVFTELAYNKDTDLTTDTDGDGSTRTASASFTFGLDRRLDLTLPEDVEGEILISYTDDNTVYDDAQGTIVIETTWTEDENEDPEFGVWSDDSSVTLAISSTGSHLIYLIIPQGFPVPSLNTNLPIRHNTLDLTYTSLSLTSESRNITGTYNVTGSIDFRTETGDIDVDVHVSSPPSPERRHRGGGPKGRLEEEEDESTEEGRWYWPFKAKGEGEGDNRVQDRYVSGGNPDGVNDGASAGEMVDSPDDPGRPNDSPHRKHRRPVPDPTPPGEGHGFPDHGPRRPPAPPHHPPGPAPPPDHSHGPPPPPPHYPLRPPHRGPHGPPPPAGSPPAVIRAHSMTGSITLRIHSDPVDIIDTDMKKHRGDKHRRDNHTRPVDIEAYTSTGSVSVTDKSFFGLFEAGTIEGKLEVKTDTEKGKGIEVIRRKVGEKGGRVEGFVKCGNGTRVDEDEVVVDIKESLDSPRHDPKELSRPPHSSPPRHDHPNHPPPPHGPPPPPHGPPPPPHGPHGPPHGPPGPHRPDGPPPPPPGLSRVSAYTVVGDVQLNL